ncbi:DNA mismatch repair protein [Aspergillus ellipticus CBS 707.79]|uniref:DNA mismatch repair protein n=1 Tax=Aspergillus ellipticus CBS 707.79 TaxID=1448320 RepID=A0A319DF73_9EURO|nr:DNA mismatch repair protein [Aspergillus ellipticus CBS 707.79]
MSSKDSRIQPLPSDAVAKIKSSTAITHLNGVIVELVKNALDANARTLYVTVDFVRGGCVVEDDGDGIPPLEFELDGGLGKAHHTSKYHSSQDVCGRRGLFLASLSALSLLTITSHHIHHPSTNTITFHHSTPVARLMPAPVYQALRFSAHGTSVTVHDLFGNMPVRVKSRALALQRPDELERHWEELKQLLISLMVANDRMAKLVVSLGRERRLTVCPRTMGCLHGDELDLHRIGSILTQGGLVDSQNTASWNTVSANVSDFSVRAALSLAPCPTKKVQFVSLGPDPVFSRTNTNLIYNEVNRLFASSDFGTTSGPSSLVGKGIPVKDEDSQGINVKPMSKSVNKWPMFYIRINTRDPRGIHDDTQNLPESEKSLQRIIDVLSAMINEFLRQAGLRPRPGKRKRDIPKTSESATSPHNSTTGRSLPTGDPPSGAEELFCGQLKLPSFRRPANVSHHFGNWSRIKTAKKDTFAKRLPLRAAESNSTSYSEAVPVTPVELPPVKKAELLSQVIDNEGSSVELPDLPHERKLCRSNANDSQEESQADTMVSWVDPYTGKSHMVNSRTGQSMLPGASVASLLERRPRSTGSLLGPILAQDSAKRPRSAALNSTQNEWVDNILENWTNPVFERPEKPISIIDTSASHGAAGRSGSSSHDRSGELFGLGSLGVSKFKGKLQKQDLKVAEIIAQVDQKFILARMRAVSNNLADPASSLVLIDQHAADERCRVEMLLAGLFAPSGDPDRIQTINLEPIIFEIPASQASLFERYKSFFSFWGISYAVEQGPKDLNAFIFVHTLPALIAERCRTEPGLVTDLIRREIWRREEENGPGRPADLEDQSDPGSWVERLDGCPPGVIDLLNSRACRTAIMFNDVLSVDECQNLVGRVADCVFPFQCAHGRPSMIPILDISGDMEQDPSDDEYDGPGFIDAFKAWQDAGTG